MPGGQVVYESHARNDGPYNVSADIFPAMFEAALQGFPNPPAGPRKSTSRWGLNPCQALNVMEATRLIAVRHGETAWNVDTRLQGHLDIGLNAKGCGKPPKPDVRWPREPITAVYSSDLVRARLTAEAIAAPRGLVVQTDEALRERSFGQSKGVPLPRSKSNCPSRRCVGASATRTSRPKAASR